MRYYKRLLTCTGKLGLKSPAPSLNSQVRNVHCKTLGGQNHVLSINRSWERQGCELGFQSLKDSEHSDTCGGCYNSKNWVYVDNGPRGIQDANQLFELFNKTGKGYGDSRTEEVLVDAFLKSFGVSSNHFYRLDLDSYPIGHQFVVYYDPLSRSFRAYVKQLLTRDSSNIEDRYMFYIFRIPIN